MKKILFFSITLVLSVFITSNNNGTNSTKTCNNTLRVAADGTLNFTVTGITVVSQGATILDQTLNLTQAYQDFPGILTTGASCAVAIFIDGTKGKDRMKSLSENGTCVNFNPAKTQYTFTINSFPCDMYVVEASSTINCP